MTAPDQALATASACRLAALIRDKSVSSRELLRLYLDRVERLNPGLNAVVTIDAQRAERDAAAADAATLRGEKTGPLHGVPFTVKDAIEVGGMRSTGGSLSLSDHVPAADAPAVARLRDAGAVVFGKTNCPEWSADFQTFNELFGTTNNPWDPALTPGGSSGGAAAALAAGLTGFELGTDIGGSIRIPSSFCGVAGHKPSFGIVSQLGYLDRVGGGTISPDINVFGPIARTVEDLELLLGILIGPDPDNVPAWRVDLPPARKGPDASAYRIGLWLDDDVCAVDATALAALRAAAQQMEAAGAQVLDAHPPIRLADAKELFGALILPAVSLSIAGEPGRRLGGNHRDWLRLKIQQVELRRAWAEWFQNFDALMCPVTPMLPFRHDHFGSINDRFVEINGQRRSLAEALTWTGMVGVASLPSTVVPVGIVPGQSGNPVPVGVQIVGPYLGDRTTLFLAAHLAEMSGPLPAPIS